MDDLDRIEGTIRELFATAEPYVYATSVGFGCKSEAPLSREIAYMARIMWSPDSPYAAYSGITITTDSVTGMIQELKFAAEYFASCRRNGTFPHSTEDTDRP
jgi:hypothetical protein